VVIMGARRIFSRGGQIRGLRTKVPQRGPEMEPRWKSRGEARWESKGEAPKSRRHVVKVMRK